MSVIADYETHLRRRNLSKATLRRRGQLLRAFANWLEVPILEATAETIELFLDTRRRAGPRSRYHYLSDFACFFEWAVETELVDKNPTARIHRPRLARLLPRPISEEDLELALSVSVRDMHLWLLLGAYEGLRVMEMAGLDAGDILWHDDALRVLGKGNKEREVPLHPLVADGLRSWSLPRRGPVFTRPRGGRWLPDGISIEVSQFFAGLGMPWTAHNLRHRFGTMIQEETGDLRVTQELMGHANPNTTAIYTKHSRRKAREAVLALPVAGTAGGAMQLPLTGMDHWAQNPGPRFTSP